MQVCNCGDNNLFTCFLRLADTELRQASRFIRIKDWINFLIKYAWLSSETEVSAINHHHHHHHHHHLSSVLEVVVLLSLLLFTKATLHKACDVRDTNSQDHTAGILILTDICPIAKKPHPHLQNILWMCLSYSWNKPYSCVQMKKYPGNKKNEGMLWTVDALDSRFAEIVHFS